VKIAMYIEVNGIQLYYEKTGQGKPVILVHGNSENHGIFDVLTKQLLNEYCVYAVDSRDHGRSSRVKQLHYDDMAEDIAAFIDKLQLQGAILYGFSDGGIIGLMIASRHPGLLSRLVISGANLNVKGVKPVFNAITWLVYAITRNKKFKLMLKEPDIKDEELSKINIPTLVLAGSRDMIKEEHTMHIAEQIPGSTLRLLEGETHSSYVVHSEKLYDIIRPFIEDDNAHIEQPI
jgi:pimeloyl-ACP methyl ester carboxylesterase